MGRSKVTVWIFSNRRRGISKYHVPVLLLISLPFLFSLLVAGSAIGLMSLAGYSLPWGYAGFFSDETALAHSLRQAGVVVGEQEEGKIEDLADALAQVRKFQAQLELRASALNSLLNDTKLVDGGPIEAQAGAVRSSSSILEGKGGGKSSGDQPGVGGGDGSRASLHKVRGAAPSNRIQPQGLFEALDFQLERLKSVPLGVPVFGQISSRFGVRVSPFNGSLQQHDGIDFSMDTHSTVVAVGDGVVVSAGPNGAYGLAVIIDHGDGIETLYGHLSKVGVQVGQRVCRGREIGQVGSTGRSTGPHLHYEVRVRGVAVDPAPFIELVHLIRVLA